MFEKLHESGGNSLIDQYGGLANGEDAIARDEQLKADRSKTWCAWYGPTVDGNGRISVSRGPRCFELVRSCVLVCSGRRNEDRRGRRLPSEASQDEGGW